MTRTTLEQQAAELARKRAELPWLEQLDLANGGSRRTPEKRALLQALQDMAAEQGREPPFKAKF